MYEKFKLSKSMSHRQKTIPFDNSMNSGIIKSDKVKNLPKFKCSMKKWLDTVLGPTWWAGQVPWLWLIFFVEIIVRLFTFTATNLHLLHFIFAAFLHMTELGSFLFFLVKLLFIENQCLPLNPSTKTLRSDCFLLLDIYQTRLRLVTKNLTYDPQLNNNPTSEVKRPRASPRTKLR